MTIANGFFARLHILKCENHLRGFHALAIFNGQAFLFQSVVKLSTEYPWNLVRFFSKVTCCLRIRTYSIDLSWRTFKMTPFTLNVPIPQVQSTSGKLTL